MKKLFFYSCFVCCVLLSVIAVADTSSSVQVFKLSHRTASEIQPLLQPMLPEDSVISGNGYQLLIKSTPEGLSQAQAIIKQLDTIPDSLIISIRRVHNAAHDLRLATHNKIKVYETDGINRRDLSQTIRVEDGKSAFIQTSKEFPIRDRHFTPFSKLDGVQQKTWYKKIKSGYRLIPHVIGNSVNIKVKWITGRVQNDHDDWQRQISPIEQEDLQTNVTVPLGQWFRLGNFSTRQLPIKNTKSYDSADLHSPDSNFYIKIDRASSYRKVRANYPQGSWKSHLTP